VLAVTVHMPYDDAPADKMVVSQPAELSIGSSSDSPATVNEPRPVEMRPRAYVGRDYDSVPLSVVGSTGVKAPALPSPRFSPNGGRHVCERLPVRIIVDSSLAKGLVEIRWKRNYEGDDLQQGGGQLYVPSDPPVFTPADMGPTRTLTLLAVATAPSLGMRASEEVSVTFEIVRPPRSVVLAAPPAAVAAAVVAVYRAIYIPDSTPDHEPTAPPTPTFTCHATAMSVCIVTEAEAWYTINGGDPRPGEDEAAMLRRGQLLPIPSEGTTVLRARAVVRGEGGRVEGWSDVVQRVFVEGVVGGSVLPRDMEMEAKLALPFGSPPPDPPMFVAHARAVVLVGTCDDPLATLRYTTDGTEVGPTSRVMPLGGLSVPTSHARRGVELRMAAHRGEAWSGEVVHPFGYGQGDSLRGTQPEAHPSSATAPLLPISSPSQLAVATPPQYSGPSPLQPELLHTPSPEAPPVRSKRRSGEYRYSPAEDALSGAPIRRPRDGFSAGRRAAQKEEERRAQALLSLAGDMRRTAAQP